MESKEKTINEFTFTYLVEFSRIAVQNGEISKDMAEKMLERIALENELSPQIFVGI